MTEESQNLDAIENPCPICGQSRSDLEAACGECRWRPWAARTPPLEQVKVTAKMLLRAMQTVSISSLFLITALVAVCAAIGTADLPSGIYVGVTGGIAFMRSALHALYAKAAQQPLSGLQKVGSFIQSFVFVFACLSVSSITFLITCTMGAVATNSGPTSLTFGVLCSLLAMTVLLWNVPVYRPRQ